MNRCPSDQTDKHILRQNIERIVAGKFGNHSVVTGVQHSRYAYIGSYDCELVTVQLSTGDEFRLFLKDYRVSQKSKDEREHRRERELRVYRDLLSQAELGPPEYYGSVWDASAGRFWLFLEFVDGLIVQHEDVEYGMLAADWLGRMQGFFIQHPEILSSSDFLIRQDGEFFRSKAERALWNVAQISPASARRLTEIVERYEQVIKVLESQPLSLVHGGYIPWHILVDITHRPVRVCAVDWESAAFGPTLYDLAYYTYGMEAQSRARVLDAYQRTASLQEVPTPDRIQMHFIVDCLGLHRIFDWLSRGLEKRFSEDKVAKLVDQAEQLSIFVLSLGSVS
jgi:aminoglycoside phosphotransferase (APT) family kinase protein